MTTAMPATPFACPAPAQRLERAATALRSHGFTVEILDDAAAARTRIKDLIPQDASVSPRPARPCACRAFTRTSTPAGATRPSGHAPWPWTASPAPTTSGGCAPAPTSPWAASTRSPRPAPSSPPRPRGSQLPAYAGGAARAIWIAGAQKVVPDPCAASKSTASRWKAPAPRRLTGSPAPSTT